MPYAEVNGVNLYYETYGKGEAVVFLNGILANTASWMYQTPIFSKQYQVLLFDFRGQGKSQKDFIDHSMTVHAEDLKALLGRLGIGKAHLVGISYGAEVALMFAVKYPKLVKSLVVACATSYVDPAVKAKAERWLIAARLRSGRYLFEMVYPDVFSDKFILEKWDLVSSTAPFYDTSVDVDAFAGLLKSFLQLNITSSLSKIKAPTLVIAAEDDKIKPLRYSEIIHNEIAESVLVEIKGTGHTVTLEKPDEFNRLAFDFVENPMTALHTQNVRTRKSY
jgi:3-oxoadipate enol-lactonase